MPKGIGLPPVVRGPSRGPGLESSRPAPSTAVHQGPHPAASGSPVEVAPAVAPLRDGERFVDVSLPVAYTPVAEAPGTDDYRCFVLDPGLSRDSLVAGVDIKPGNPDLVHHVIVHKVDPDRVEEALVLRRFRSRERARRRPGPGDMGGRLGPRWRRARPR